jgi:hypothetical protein
MSRIQRWIKAAFIYVFLVCTPLLYAYANFRAVRGEMFFEAINTEPGSLYAQTINTWGIDSWEELTRRVYGTPTDMDVRIIFWWGSDASAVPDELGRPERPVHCLAAKSLGVDEGWGGYAVEENLRWQELRRFQSFHLYGSAVYSSEFTSPANCPQAPLISLPKLTLRVQAISLFVRISSNALKAARLGARNLSQWPSLSLVGL